MAANAPSEDNNDRRSDAAHTNNDSNNNSDYERQDLKPYAFSGRVVIGVALILAAAALSTILAMVVSQSPQASIPMTTFSTFSTASDIQSALAQDHAATKPDREFILVANDFGWNGTQHGPPIRVTKGDVVQLTISNAGQMSHNFGIAELSDRSVELLNEVEDMTLPERVEYLPYDALAAMPCPDCERKLHHAHIAFFIKPGNQVTVTFTAEEAGEFKYFCMVRGHLWLGMNGDIIVEEPAAVATASPGEVDT